jgi:DNA-binding NtrC family response regulator
MKQLMDHHWPGNVRELQNVLERAYIDSDNELLDRFSFSQYGGNFCGLTSLEPANPEIPFNIARSVVVKRFERDYFSEALRRYQGNISETAQKTGVNTRTLWRKISEFKLDRAAFKRTD